MTTRDGILIVDKPEGLTSAEVVRRVKGRRRLKVGHLGTLDPFATGVLPLCVGEGTKIAQFLNAADKRYEGVIRLGAATDTGDRTGTTVREAAVPDLTDAALREVERRFTGEYTQIPPMYSAIKQSGVPLYRLARQGVEVERDSRSVRLEGLRLTRSEDSRLSFDVTCSKGTYVRVLAEDIGARLGTVAHLEVLRRTRFGPFDLSRAVGLRDADPLAHENVLSVRDALAHLPSFALADRAAQAARKGQGWVLRGLDGPEGELATLVDPQGHVVAVVVRRSGRWEYGRVLQGPALQPGTPVLSEQD
ncbi:MAG TPA: tRNA pseudouridine(55) synthase TruB [Candidatus Binatia bacterium]|nr:tRNA pseudouridine(55) synthase TruB [Candidatus Binatia bacterium]